MLPSALNGPRGLGRGRLPLASSATATPRTFSHRHDRPARRDRPADTASLPSRSHRSSELARSVRRRSRPIGRGDPSPGPARPRLPPSEASWPARRRSRTAPVGDPWDAGRRGRDGDDPTRLAPVRRRRGADEPVWDARLRGPAPRSSTRCDASRSVRGVGGAIRPARPRPKRPFRCGAVGGRAPPAARGGRGPRPWARSDSTVSGMLRGACAVTARRAPARARKVPRGLRRVARSYRDCVRSGRAEPPPIAPVSDPGRSGSRPSRPSRLAGSGDRMHRDPPRRAPRPCAGQRAGAPSPSARELQPFPSSSLRRAQGAEPARRRGRPTRCGDRRAFGARPPRNRDPLRSAGQRSASSGPRAQPVVLARPRRATPPQPTPSGFAIRRSRILPARVRFVRAERTGRRSEHVAFGRSGRRARVGSGADCRADRPSRPERGRRFRRVGGVCRSSRPRAGANRPPRSSSIRADRPARPR